jgi:hypothetical protein
MKSLYAQNKAKRIIYDKAESEGAAYMVKKLIYYK